MRGIQAKSRNNSDLFLMPCSCSVPGFVLLFFLSGLCCFAAAADETDQPFYQTLGKALVQGVIEANTREIPVNEALALFEMPLPHLRVPRHNQHPRLLYSQDAFVQIRARQTLPPWSDWADQMIHAANSQITDVASPIVNESRRSTYAKLNSFAYVLTGQAHYRNEALSAFRKIRKPDPMHSIQGGKTDIGWGDWMQAAEALRAYCVAYDLLYREISVSDRELIEARLSGQANQLMRALPLVPKNNHSVVIACGLGTAALTLSHPANQQWLDAAMDELKSSLMLIEPDGSYREGAYYARFVASHLYPLFFYINNITQINLFRHRRIILFDQWLADMILPNGDVPDFDDAFPENWLYEPIAMGLSLKRKSCSVPFETRRNRLNPSDPAWIEAYCAYRPVGQIHFDVQSSFYPHGGMAVFRGSHELYGLLLGEPGRPFMSGHDHAEPMNFTLHAFGRPWLVEGGYGPGGSSNPDRSYFMGSQSHNIPLIDGLGPDENPVWGDNLGGQLIHSFVLPQMTASTVKARYREADFERQVYMVNQRFFLVHDHIVSESRHHLSIPWHGMGQFRQISGHQVKWIQDENHIDAFFFSKTAALHLSTGQGLHTLSKPGTHTRVELIMPNVKQGEMISFFLPQSEEQGLLEIVPHPVQLLQNVSLESSAGHQLDKSHKPFGDELNADDRSLSDALNVQAWEIMNPRSIESTVIVTGNGPWQAGHIKSDGHTVLFQERSFDAPAQLIMICGTCLEYQGQIIIQTDAPVTAALVLDEAGWYGHVRPSCSDRDSVCVHVCPPFHAETVWVNKKKADVFQSEPGLAFYLKSGGIVELGHNAGQVRSAETWRPNLRVMDRLQSASNRQDALNHLTSEDRIQLKNEIIQVMGQEIMNQADEVTSHKNLLKNTYSILSGLANAGYNRLGPEPALPQQLRLQGQIGCRQLNYYGEGFFTARGWTLRQQQLQLDGDLFLAHTHAFSGHHEGRAFLSRPSHEMQSHVEVFEGDVGYHLHWTRFFSDHWFSIQQQQGLEGQRNHHIGFGRSGWNSRIHFAEEAGGPALVNILANQQSRGHSLSFQMTAEEGTGLQSVYFEQGWQMHPHFYCQLGYQGHQLGNAALKAQQVRSQFWYSDTRLNGRLLLLQETEGILSGLWRAQYGTGAWRWTTFGSFGRVDSRQWGLTHRRKDVSWQIRLYDLDSILGQGAIQLSHAWSCTGGAQIDLDRGGWVSRTAGLSYQGFWQLGGQIRFVREQHRLLKGFTGVLGLPLGGQELVHCYVSLLKDPMKLAGFYEVQLMQTGRHRTPGLLLLGNDRGVARLEGYLRWTF